MGRVHLQTHSHGVDRPPFITGYWSEASVLHHTDLSIGCLSVSQHGSWFHSKLVSEEIREREKEKWRGKKKHTIVFYNPIF